MTCCTSQSCLKRKGAKISYLGPEGQGIYSSGETDIKNDATETIHSHSFSKDDISEDLESCFRFNVFLIFHEFFDKYYANLKKRKYLNALKQ